MVFCKILMCCDGSKYSDKAIILSCNIAKKFDSDLTLMYVVDKTMRSDIFAGSEYTKILRKYAQDTIRRAQRVAKSEGIEPNVIIKEGNVTDEIVRYSKKSKTDLIVVGSKGLGAVLRFMLGSVSTKIANHSLCSVLIVK